MRESSFGLLSVDPLYLGAPQGLVVARFEAHLPVRGQSRLGDLAQQPAPAGRWAFPAFGPTGLKNL